VQKPFTPPLRATLIILALLPVIAAAQSLLPEIGIPLRDASVLRAPQGVYYLTGTTPGDYPGSPDDWQNNRGVRVWKSDDLREWEDLGLVWDLTTDPETGHDARWQTELYPWPGAPDGVRARGMIAPRLAHDGERFWITYSMNGYGAGAMPGSGQVDGTYLNTKVMHEISAAPTDKSDASLFTDTDGTVYLVWGGGNLAKTRNHTELQAMAKKGDNEVGVEDPIHYLPARIEGWPNLQDMPQHGAPYGVSVFHHQGRYYFTFTATTKRDGGIHEDSFICTADHLLGPYSPPRLLALDSGRVTLFTGPDNTLLYAHSNTSDEPMIHPVPQAAPSFGETAIPAQRLQAAEELERRPRFPRPDDVPQLLETITPAIDHPLRDASIAQGPDGDWWMIGTEPSLAPDGTLDWANNRGIRLWSSPDRKIWKDQGLVFDLDRDGDEAHRVQNLDITVGATPRLGRAVTAPEIHYLNGAWWIVYTLNGQGIRILRADEPTGPWKQHAVLTRQGRDPSLFVEEGQTFLVWGAGFMAPLNDSMTALDGPVRTLFTRVNWNPRYMRRPELMGLWGSHLIKEGDWYVWTFTTRTGRNGINAIDTMASWSRSLDGPFADPCTMLPNGGQADVVADGNGGWLATVSGEDEMSEVPFRPAITPVVSDGATPGSALSLRPFRENETFTHWQAVNGHEATWLDLWIGHPDFIPHAFRDTFITYDPDTDAYYTTGSFWGVDEWRRGAAYYSSPDLLHWTPSGYLYEYNSLKADGMIPEDQHAAFDEMVEKDAEGGNWKFRIQIGEQKIWKLNDDWFFNMQPFNRPGGHFLLKSTSGSIKGPYEPVNEIMGVADLMQDDDGSVLFNFTGDRLRRFPDAETFTSLHKSEWGPYPWNDLAHQEPWLQNITFSEDAEAGIMKLGGKYVTWTTDWTGSYDAVYRFADQWDGPYQGAMRILPFGGNGKFFQTRDGQWMWTYFYNSNEYASRGQNHVRMNMYPVFVGMENGELIIEPIALRQNREWINRHGKLW